MALASANTAEASEAARLARCMKAVRPLLAATVGLPSDLLVSTDEQDWTFIGGATAIRWTGDAVEQTLKHSLSVWFFGEVRILLRAVGKDDDMDLRCAGAWLALARFSAQGSSLIEDNAHLIIGPDEGLPPKRFGYPHSDFETPVAVFDVPFALKLTLQHLADPLE